MARWCTLTSLLLVTLGVPGVTLAQSYEPIGNGVVPAGWNEPGQTHVGQKSKVRSYGPMGPLPAGPGRTIYEELPDDTGWLYEDTPLERALKDAFRHAYFRVDYLNWNLSAPGNNLIGASGTDIIGFDEISSGGLTNDPATNTFAYPNGAADPYVFQAYRDPLTAFQVSNPGTNNTSLIAVVQPSMKDVQINGNNGIRGTFGLPVMNIGTLEASFFAMQNSNNSVLRDQVFQYDIYDSNGNGIFGETFTPLTVGEFDRNGNGQIDDVVGDFQGFATPILIDMQVPQYGIVDANTNPNTDIFQLPPITNPLSPGTELDPETADPTDVRVIPGRGDNFRIVWAVRDPTNPVEWIPAYHAQLKTTLWGSESNFLLNPYDANSPLSIRPMVGFRYMRFAEDFRQNGQYTYLDANNTESIVDRKIDTTTVNNIYGPQVGLRAELTSKWFTLGVQPKVMMGLNSYKADLATVNILSPDDLDQNLKENKSTFGVIGDLEAYTKLHLTEHLSLNVGYNLMWTGIVTRPYDNVIYNARTIETPNGDGTVTNSLESDFKLDVKYSGVLIQGLNVGAELAY